VARGAALYAQMCAVCHAEHGEGYKADQATALNQQDFLASVSNDFLGFAIAHGRKGTTMSAWLQDRGGPLSEADIHALIARLRVWQKQPSVTLDERPVQGDADHGKQLFNQHCAQCHGPKTGYVRILARQFLSTATDGYLRHAIRVGRSPTPMLAYDKVLGDQGIEDVIAYMRTFPSTPELPAPDAPAPPLPLGKIPLNPSGPEPQQFQAFPAFTSVEVVHKAYARKARIGILDARAPTDYADKHIAGAVSVPFYDPSPYLQQLPKNAWLVAYCGCPHAESGALAAKLMDAGFKKVTVLDEGLLVWSDRGYPTRSGTEP
jgi:cytochrome c oxidase cbb3-type subunit 3/ubiquinol-cytochrome c reductase cytochrome c subunit